MYLLALAEVVVLTLIATSLFKMLVYSSLMMIQLSSLISINLEMAGYDINQAVMD